ncbi:MAG: DUF2510 domain-containing protein [Ilumatobacteraceae bacterium]
MNGGISLGVYLAAGIVLGLICMVVAMGKGQQAWVGFLLGFFLSCAGLIVVLLMKNGNAPVAGIPPPHPNSQWFPDPTGRHQYRLWDGQRWSGHVSDSGRAGFDPLA